MNNTILEMKPGTICPKCGSHWRPMSSRAGIRFGEGNGAYFHTCNVNDVERPKNPHTGCGCALGGDSNIAVICDEHRDWLDEYLNLKRQTWLKMLREELLDNQRKPA